MSGFLDIHSHILPGLDDGPGEVEDAAQLVQGLAELGFSDHYPTPHQKSGSWTPTAEERESAAGALIAHLGALGAEATIHPPGGENMWDDLFLSRQLGEVEEPYPTYPGGKAVLIEFAPDAFPPMIEERLFQLRISRGQLPVLAHVERYPAAAKRGGLEALGRGAALLVNLSTLGGMSGWGARRLARRLVRQRLVHAAATDTHSAEDIGYSGAGIQWIRSALGADALRTLLLDNPRRILAGELPEP
jgi:protein-tyrosine phosphatase